MIKLIAVKKSKKSVHTGRRWGMGVGRERCREGMRVREKGGTEKEGKKEQSCMNLPYKPA
jgi:hypothetical protein